MTFLLPAGLLALLALPVLVLLYLFRSRYQPRRISSLILWRRVPRDEATATTVRRPRWEWLLVLQLLVAGALALMLARPAVQLPGGRHLGIVMDISASMAARDVPPSRFVVARQRAATLARDAGARDRFTLVSAGRQPRLVLLAGSGAALTSALDGLQTEDGAPDMGTAIALAAGQNDPDASGMSEVVVFTDRAGQLGVGPGDIPVSFQLTEGGNERLAIAYASVRRAPDGGGRLAGFASVVNPGQQARTGTLTVTGAGGILSRIGLELPAEGRQDVTFVGPAGATALTVALADEEPWPGGNRLQLDAPGRYARSVLIVSEAPGPWEHALAVVPDVLTRSVTPAEYQASAEGDDAIVLFDRVLPPLLPNAPLILIDPPDRADLLVRASDVARTRTAVDLDTHDPLLRGIDLAPLSATGRPATLPRWAAAPAQAADGPLILYGTWQARPVVALTFDPQQSNLAQLEAFPLLLANVVDWLTPGRADILQAGLGRGALLADSRDTTPAVQPQAPTQAVSAPSVEVWVLFAALALLAWLAEWLVAWGGARRWLGRLRGLNA